MYSKDKQLQHVSDLVKEVFEERLLPRVTIASRDNDNKLTHAIHNLRHAVNELKAPCAIDTQV